MTSTPFDKPAITLLDGGFSNELNPRVKYDVHKDPLWTGKALVTEQEAVVATHLAYLEAGADIIETASYQCTIKGLQEFMNLTDEEAKGKIRDSVTLAKKAVDKYMENLHGADLAKWKDGETPLVAGSIGPYGVFLRDGSEYSGSYMKTITKAEIEAVHLPRLLALVEGGADLLVIETMPSLTEVEIILELLKRHAPTTKAWVSFSVKGDDATKSGYGDSLLTAYKKVSEYDQVVAFGINCCHPNLVEKFLTHMNTDNNGGLEGKPRLIAYPNSGQDWVRGQGWTNTPYSLDSFLEKWIELGLKGVGGCCEVGSAEIKKMRSTLDLWSASHSQ